MEVLLSQAKRAVLHHMDQHSAVLMQTEADKKTDVQGRLCGGSVALVESRTHREEDVSTWEIVRFCDPVKQRDRERERESV